MTIEEETKAVRSSSLGWMIQRIAGRLDRAMEARLSPHGLTLQQFAVMMTVLETDGLSQTEIGTRFGMPAYAISRAIDQLEKAAFLERRPHPTSRRTHSVHATDRGRELRQTLYSIVRDVNDELAAPLTGNQRKEFHKLLAKVL